jgi:hypothetical protein
VLVPDPQAGAQKAEILPIKKQNNKTEHAKKEGKEKEWKYKRRRGMEIKHTQNRMESPRIPKLEAFSAIANLCTVLPEKKIKNVVSLFFFELLLALSPFLVWFFSSLLSCFLALFRFPNVKKNSSDAFEISLERIFNHEIARACDKKNQSSQLSGELFKKPQKVSPRQVFFCTSVSPFVSFLRFPPSFFVSIRFFGHENTFEHKGVSRS